MECRKARAGILALVTAVAWLLLMPALPLFPSTASAAEVSGVKFYDANTNGVQDPGEPGLSDWRIFADLNQNGTWEGGVDAFEAITPVEILDDDTTTVTLTVSALVGTIVDVNVRLDIEHSWDEDLDVYLISPLGTRVELFTDVGLDESNFTGTVLDDEASTHITNGTAPFTGSFRPEGSLSDFDGETPNGTWTLEITDDEFIFGGTLNQWALEFGKPLDEPTDWTASDGSYALPGLTGGTYRIREILQPGWTQTYPTAGYYQLTLGGAQTANTNDFGNFAPLDFGDAPDGPYPTRQTNGGPSHIIAGPFIGTTAGDGEADGQPTANADGDDIAGTDDEDGVTANMTAGLPGVVQVSVGGGGGVLDAWIDFDGDGIWQEPQERIYGAFLADGLHPIPVTPPLDATTPEVFGRFRISTAGGLGPGGLADDGEVQDHVLDLVEPAHISGIKFYDANTNGVQDPGEYGLADWLIYIDSNNNSQLDGVLLFPSANVPVTVPDLTTVTSTLAVSVPPDTIVDVNLTLDIAHKQVDDLHATLVGPSGTRVQLFSEVGGTGDNFQGIMLDDQALTNVVNGTAPFSGRFQPQGLLTGNGLEDFNGEDPSGTWGLEIEDDVPGDVGILTRWVLQLTLSSATGEAYTFTSGDGRYDFGPLHPGAYKVREILPDHWLQTAPTSGLYSLNLNPGDVANTNDFGNYALLDFGDAPEATGSRYPTTLARDGARHVLGGPYFGVLADDESDGQPSASALGDDTGGSADEDGIAIPTLVQGVTTNIAVQVGSGGVVRAWIDFNGDGDWVDAGEFVYGGFLATGAHQIPVTPPVQSIGGTPFARFRISSGGTGSDRGAAPDGEVEDYVVDIEAAPGPTAPWDTAWGTPLDGEHAIDVPTYTMDFVGPRVADDFFADGRPITGLRWWGSYLDYENGTSGQVYPPAGRPFAFRVRVYRNTPAGVLTNYPLPSAQIVSQLHLDYAETYYTSIWHAAEGIWEHEFVYEVAFEDEWLLKPDVYWLSVYPLFAGSTDYFWGWATTTMESHWQGAAVRRNAGFGPGIDWEPLIYSNVRPLHVYEDYPVDTAFEVLTDVQDRRGVKWVQPPDMITGENMPSWNAIPALPPPGGWQARADDFESDGRPITDVHWWGSYLAYAATNAGPVGIPTNDRPTEFVLRWMTDAPSNGVPYSRPAVILRELPVPIEHCHEVYFGTVVQSWKPGPDIYEHEFQYYVDLMDPDLDALPDWGPWGETNGVIYWLGIEAVFDQTPTLEHGGWGWKTTPLGNRWNDASAVATGGVWQPAQYPVGHTNYPASCDLAFELTTDEPGTNQWSGPLRIEHVSAWGSFGNRIGSVGDSGAGEQYLEVSTNLLTNIWEEVQMRPYPRPAPGTTFWYRLNPVNSNEFYRVKQR